MSGSRREGLRCGVQGSGRDRWWRVGLSGEVVEAYPASAPVLGRQPAGCTPLVLGLAGGAKASAVRMLAIAKAQASMSAWGVSPIRRHQPRLVSMPAGSAIWEKLRSAVVRRA